jgi:hypothetical protein
MDWLRSELQCFGFKSCVLIDPSVNDAIYLVVYAKNTYHGHFFSYVYPGV